MTLQERAALDALLARMRTLHEELAQHQPGVCILHLEAAIAALESHIARGGASMLEAMRPGLAPSTAC